MPFSLKIFPLVKTSQVAHDDSDVVRTLKRDLCDFSLSYLYCECVMCKMARCYQSYTILKIIHWVFFLFFFFFLNWYIWYIWYIDSENLYFILILKKKNVKVLIFNVIHFSNFEISASL